MPSRKLQQVYEGEWVTWKRHDRLQCCDCLLIHDLEFRVRDKRLEIRMFRNNRSTAAYRREQGIKIATKKQ